MVTLPNHPPTFLVLELSIKLAFDCRTCLSFQLFFSLIFFIAFRMFNSFDTLFFTYYAFLLFSVIISCILTLL